MDTEAAAVTHHFIGGRSSRKPCCCCKLLPAQFFLGDSVCFGGGLDDLVVSLVVFRPDILLVVYMVTKVSRSPYRLQGLELRILEEDVNAGETMLGKIMF